MNWYLKVLKDYAVFTGRARRAEYWMFTLFHIIVLILAAILDNILGSTFDAAGQTLPYGYIYLIYSLGVMIPSLAVSVRRLHDVGKSGWFMLIAIIPLVGIIWLLVLLCTDSKPEENQYGPNPKQEDLLVEADTSEY